MAGADDVNVGIAAAVVGAADDDDAVSGGLVLQPVGTTNAASTATAPRAPAEDRIGGLKDTGMTNLPLHAFAKNQIWLELVQLAAELLTWTQLLACDHHPPASARISSSSKARSTD